MRKLLIVVAIVAAFGLGGVGGAWAQGAERMVERSYIDAAGHACIALGVFGQPPGGRMPPADSIHVNCISPAHQQPRHSSHCLAGGQCERCERL